MRMSPLILCLALAACGRPLTEGERAFVTAVQGDTVDPKAVRITPDVPLGVATFQYKKRPRLACRERINPPPSGDTISASVAGVVLYNHLYTSPDWSVDDYLPDYPAQLHLTAALYFAHEMTHIWQWQNRAITGYSPTRAAQEHGGGADPYLFEIDTETRFLDYAYEQQASVVEEYLCCALLDPEAPRTARLKSLVGAVFPTDRLPQSAQVVLPWEDVKLAGICR